MEPGQIAAMMDPPARGDRAVGVGLIAAAQSIIADARKALTDPEPTEPEAVHDLRKAFKRWRAFLRLLSVALGEPAERMRTEARELMRALSGARDAQAALDALDDLGKSEQPFSATSVETIRARLTGIRDAAEKSSFTPGMRERLSRYLELAALSIERWPLRDIDFDTVSEGLTRTYRRARQRVPESWLDADSEHLHELRRRVVEHRHQMDLIEPLWPRLGQVWSAEAQCLRNQLGACQDLAVLASLTAPHRPLARWRSRLGPLMEERRAAHLETAARLAGRLFAEKPKAFQGRIDALWLAGRKRKHGHAGTRANGQGDAKT